MGLERLSFGDKRAGERIPVFHRTRAVGPAGEVLSLIVVDVSAKGLMARCATPFAAGSRLQVTLPGVGVRFAEVRWSLGGRIGCELDHPIGLEAYYEMLTLLMREENLRR